MLWFCGILLNDSFPDLVKGEFKNSTLGLMKLLLEFLGLNIKF